MLFYYPHGSCQVRFIRNCQYIYISTRLEIGRTEVVLIGGALEYNLTPAVVECQIRIRKIFDFFDVEEIIDTIPIGGNYVFDNNVPQFDFKGHIIAPGLKGIGRMPCSYPHNIKTRPDWFIKSKSSVACRTDQLTHPRVLGRRQIHIIGTGPRLIGRPRKQCCAAVSIGECGVATSKPNIIGRISPGYNISLDFHAQNHTKIPGFILRFKFTNHNCCVR